MKLLSALNLSHSYEYPLFKDLNFDLKCGQSMAILGVSGCGKSTLLHTLCTLLKPNDGEVFYDSKSLYSLSSSELLKIRRFDFGIIFQSHYLFKGFSAIENIQISTILSSKNIDLNLMKKLKILDILKNRVTNLSGGQQQRVSIARVLSKKPKIIFADEPTGNLDKNTAKDVMNTIFEYIDQNQAALLLVTHDEELAKQCTSSYRLIEQKLCKI